jgi:hypothetical protein
LEYKQQQHLLHKARGIPDSFDAQNSMHLIMVLRDGFSNVQNGALYGNCIKALHRKLRTFLNNQRLGGPAQ